MNISIIEDGFLKEVGLDSLPEEQKQSFFNHLQEELEVRVGEKLSEGFSENQALEYERIIDGNQLAIKSFLDSSPGYEKDSLYATLAQETDLKEDSAELLKTFVNMKWLAQNCPNYQEIVNGVLDTLKQEIKENGTKF
jgi:hypothetical protein